jgi:hypothetical protein
MSREPAPGRGATSGGEEKGKTPAEAGKVLCNHRDAEALAASKMPDYLGADQRKTKEEEKDDKPIRGERTRAGSGRRWHRRGAGFPPPRCPAGLRSER